MFPFVNPVQALNLSIRTAMLVSEAQMIIAMRMLAMAGLWQVRPLAPVVAKTAPAPGAAPTSAATDVAPPAPIRAPARRRAARGTPT